MRKRQIRRVIERQFNREIERKIDGEFESEKEVGRLRGKSKFSVGEGLRECDCETESGGDT